MKQTPQQAAARSTEQNGSREGFTAMQFYIRQLALLQVKLAALTDLIRENGMNDEDSDFEWKVKSAGQYADSLLEHNLYFPTQYCALRHDTEEAYSALRTEAAACQVALLNIANMIAEMTEVPFDIIGEAERQAKEAGKRKRKPHNLFYDARECHLG